MSKETGASIIRAALQVAASYLLGKHIFGQTIDTNLVASITEAVVILATTIWGFADHSAGVEQLQSGLHSFLTTTLALLSSWGVMSAQNAVAILALAGTLAPVLLSYSGRVKVKQIANGQLNTSGATGKVSPSIPVAKLLFIALIFIGGSCSAQSMFSCIPKPKPSYGFSRSLVTSATTPLPDSSFQGFRFTGPMVLYSLPGSAIYTGIGIDYEHATFQPSSGKFYTDWAVAIGGYEGGQFAPNNVQAVTAVGLSLQFFNKLLTVGLLYNLTTSKVQGGVGPSVSLNN